MGSIRLNGATSGYLEIKAPDVSPDAVLTLPSTGFGKILQVVRATDTTNRSTTSTTFVDITGVSVTITPQKSDSAILVLLNAVSQVNKSSPGLIQSSVLITDSSNNSLTGTTSGYQVSANDNDALGSVITLYGYSTPATTSPTTYKGRFRVFAAGETGYIRGDLHTTQMYALEISA